MSPRRYDFTDREIPVRVSDYYITESKKCIQNLNEKKNSHTIQDEIKNLNVAKTKKLMENENYSLFQLL